MGLLNNVIRTAVISALGAKLARGRSPLVAALITLLATRMLTSKEEPTQASKEEPTQEGPQPGGGLDSLVDRFRRGGLEDVIKSWIGTGSNKPITPNQLHQALGPETVDNLTRESGMRRDDLLSQLSRVLPEVVDKLTPKGELPPPSDLVAGPAEEGDERTQRRV